jgi:hypothetical protein
MEVDEPKPDTQRTSEQARPSSTASLIAEPFQGNDRPIGHASEPVSSSLRIVADRSLPDHVRLKPLVDGTVIALDRPADVALMRRILLDSSDEDTVRNEAANRLAAAWTPGLGADLARVLDQAGEGERFRSFAAQHLGLAWQRAQAAGTAEAATLRSRLTACVHDRHYAVRREALLALVRGGDAGGLAEAARLLAADDAGDPAVPAMRDLALRIAGETRRVDAREQVRRFLRHADATVRAAALIAAGQLGDAASRPLIAAAVQDADRQVAGAARTALAMLDGAAAAGGR